MNRSITLRTWQHDALRDFLAHDQPNFLAVACPGAGKTTFALTAARHWLRGERRPLVVVAPTRHLKVQWATAGERFGFHLEPEWDPTTGAIPDDMHGIIVTYAQAASASRVLSQVSRDGMVILDEVHHAGGDKTWGGNDKPEAKSVAGSGRIFSTATRPFSVRAGGCPVCPSKVH